MADGTNPYDPFVRGPYPVGVRTIEAPDTARDRSFPCEIWYPADFQHRGQDTDPATQDVFTAPSERSQRRQMAVRDALARDGTYPLILFSHSSGGDRKQSTFLCTHLSSHGYVVSAADHSERVAAGLTHRDGETGEQRTRRLEVVIASRVPDIRFLLAHLLATAWDPAITVDSTRIGIVGHSFGGWTALAAIDVEPKIGAVVALAPGGASERKPGILPLRLEFAWGRDVPVLYLVAENDTSLPLAGMYELFARTPATRRMLILRRADHVHFMDNAEELHEAFRSMPLTGALADLQKEMQPFAELCSEREAQVFVRGLTVAHFDARLKQREEAVGFWAEDIDGRLASRGIEAILHQT